MEIKAVKFRKDGFYSQPFVMGGEEGPGKFDRNIRYRGSLQNYLIDNMEAFAALGYKPEQVTKILLTHKHADHSGELKSYPNAKVYVNADEMDAAEHDGVAFEDLPDDWKCPRCKQGKEKFNRA